MLKAGRNDPCLCGSGKKYKQCCLGASLNLGDIDMPRKVQEYFQKRQNERERMHAIGNYLSHVQTEADGQRFRIMGNRGRWRPADETFHEFLIFVLEDTLGKEWYSDQLAKTFEERHFIAQCVSRFHQWKKRASKRHSVDGRWIATFDGWSKTLITLAYDIYSLHHTYHLPEHLITRLKNKDQYQGARYEISVAALFARLKCKIEFLDTNENRAEKHCEFIATHDETNVSIAVEAKSRHRPGIIHMPGKQDENKLARGDIQWLINRALDQNPGNRPFVIFIDLNSPLTPDIDIKRKPWAKEVRQIISSYIDADKPNSCNGFFVTNNAFHYQAENETEAGEYVVVIPTLAKFRLPSPAFMQLLKKGLDGSGALPLLE